MPIFIAIKRNAMGKHVTVTESRLHEIISAINAKSAERYPGYALKLVKRFQLTRKALSGKLEVFGFAELDSLDTCNTFSRICCISDSWYELMIHVKSDGRDYAMCSIKAGNYHLSMKRFCKKYRSRVFAELHRQLGGDGRVNACRGFVLRFDVEGLYTTVTQETGSVFIVEHVDGKKSEVQTLQHFMRKGNWEKNPIVRSTEKRLYQHVVHGTLSNTEL